MKPKPGQRHTVTICAHCSAKFHPWSKSQACCSRSCARKWSPAFLAHARSIAKRGGYAAGAKRRETASRRWGALAKGMTPAEIAKSQYRRGYSNGVKVGERYAFARGYEQALKDSEHGQAFKREVA